jgi:aconitate hydratase
LAQDVGQDPAVAEVFGELKPRQTLVAEITSADGTKQEVPLTCRIDTLDEL